MMLISLKNISETYISKWTDYGLSRDKTHAKLSYSWYGSWTTLYNLYADSLLCFHLENTALARPSRLSLDPAHTPFSEQHIFALSDDHDFSKKKSTPGFVPHDIYKLQSDWYHNVIQRYGLPLDSRHLYTKSDWEFFAAAVSDRRTRTEILQASAKWLNETSTDRPLTDLHDTEGDGGFLGAYFMARPVVGGHFAFLTLARACGGDAERGLAFLEEVKEQEQGKGNVEYEL